MPRHQLALCALAVVAVALIGARYLKEQEARGGSSASAPARSPVRLARGGSGSSAFVHVTGAVRRPGVYKLPSWGRLDLAVKRAGGPTAGADLEGVNLAAKLSDGQQ